MGLADAQPTLQIEVVYSPAPRIVDQVELRLPAGATVEHALRESGFLERYALAAVEQLSVGVWGKRCALGDVLRDRDRVEIYRPLLVDPKEARRQRYRAHLERYPPKR
jgi:putative ubiquitin-RnfH superfamily antitoxin RatB of RatAB toxin-antitoxin module